MATSSICSLQSIISIWLCEVNIPQDFVIEQVFSTEKTYSRTQSEGENIVKEPLHWTHSGKWKSVFCIYSTLTQLLANDIWMTSRMLWFCSFHYSNQSLIGLYKTVALDICTFCSCLYQFVMIPQCIHNSRLNWAISFNGISHALEIKPNTFVVYDLTCSGWF